MQQTYQSIERPDEQSITYCRKVVFTMLALAIVIFSIYSNSLNCSWHFDDEPNITSNPNLHMRELSWDSIRHAIFSDRNNPHIPYRPVACFSIALNYYFGGLDVFGYHLVNIFIHLLSSIFLFLFIYHTLNLPSLKTQYAPQSYSIALLATILWAINPVQTQAITYVVQRMASMAGMFYIMSMFFYLRARIQQPRCKKVLFLILCLISFVLAFGSKENAVMLPVSIFLYEILLLQQITGQTIRKYGKVFFIILAGILLVGFAYTYIQGGTIFSFLNGYENRPFTLVQRVLTEARVIIFYISLLLYPVPNRLSITHSFQVSTSLFDPISTFFSIVLITGATWYAIYSAKKRPLYSFVILFFFFNHAIESSVLPLELIFEHRNYIPSMPFFVPVAIGFYYVFNRYKDKTSMKYILLSFMVLVIVGLGHSTFLRNYAWKTDRSLWSDAIEKAPDSFRAYHNLGKYYHDNGYTQKAVSAYKKALMSPVVHRKNEMAVTYYNLGKIYSDLGDYTKARYFYERSMNINPEFQPAYNDFAAVLDREGKHQLAHDYLLKALRLNPDSTVAHYNIGLHYLRERQPDKAIQHLSRLSNTSEFEDRVLLYLGIAYNQKGHLGRAVNYFRMAVKKNPRNTRTYLHLAEVLYRAGNIKQAKAEAAKAINLMPNKDTLQKIVEALQGKDRSRHLQPRAAIVIPLMREACLDQSQRLKEWSNVLKEPCLH
jgi:tetratricopeptide (TPR) repeat protein